jgi:hypothetical protein
MSRTYKDRPYRVRARDPREERYETHNHLSLGKEIYSTRRKTDENGEIIFATVLYGGWRINENTRALEYYEEHRLSRYAVRETYLMGTIADHCTIDEDDNHSHTEMKYWRLTPCSYSLRWDYHNRPRRHEKKDFHSSARSNEGIALTKLVNYWNAGMDEDENFEETDLYTRTHFHKGWWD